MFYSNLRYLQYPVTPGQPVAYIWWHGEDFKESVCSYQSLIARQCHVQALTTDSSSSMSVYFVGAHT